MPWPVHPTGFFGARGDNDSYRIERSLRFNSADSAYLNRTLGTPTSQSIFTFSCWVKRSTLSSSQPIFSNSSGTEVLYFKSTDALEFYKATTSYTTTAVFRDVSAWGHLVFSSNSGTIKLYWNGVEFLSSSVTPASLNSNGVTHYIGRDNVSYFSGYLTEINFIDGQALTPSSFGETDAITGRWKAKAYSGTYGTNGFYLKFADNSGTTDTTLGKDSSPNGNNWTPNNFSVTAGAGNDSLVDSPTNYGTDSGVGGEVRGNYCTLNPLKTNSAFTLSNGNLDFSATSSAINSLYVTSSVGVSSGKWYWEVTPSNIGAGPNIFVGIRLSSASTTSGSSGIFDSGYGYGAGGNKLDGTGGASYGASYANNDVVGIALDLDAGTLVFYKNGVSQGTAFSGLSGTFEPAINLNVAGVSRTIAGFCNFGQRPFAYTAPAGFKALCTTNLPQPTIQKPSKYMDVVAYTGTGASNSISSLGFSPDLVWIKNRGGATDHALYDTTRGTQAQLSSNTTGSEVTSSTGLTAFGTNGFTIGTSSLVNTSGTQYVAWSWDEAPIAGMDIVSYTGNGANRTISHGLGVSPKMMIVKNTSSTSDWGVYHSNLTSASYYIYLSSTNGENIATTMWNGTAPTSSVFSVGTSTNVNANNDNYIAYLFAEVEGFSKFGSYTGNGSADGPFVWCGFRPRYLLIKRTDTANSWIIYDTARDPINAIGVPLVANGSDQEGSLTSDMDILSNGFKFRTTGVGRNASGGTYIFAAFAESPFKYARAR